MAGLYTDELCNLSRLFSPATYRCIRNFVRGGLSLGSYGWLIENQEVIENRPTISTSNETPDHRWLMIRWWSSFQFESRK